MENNMQNVNNIRIEIINSLAIKIANLEVQVAALTAENKILQQSQSTNVAETYMEDETDESSE